jgi:hypothetical protein
MATREHVAVFETVEDAHVATAKMPWAFPDAGLICSVASADRSSRPTI